MRFQFESYVSFLSKDRSDHVDIFLPPRSIVPSFVFFQNLLELSFPWTFFTHWNTSQITATSGDTCDSEPESRYARSKPIISNYKGYRKRIYFGTLLQPIIRLMVYIRQKEIVLTYSLCFLWSDRKTIVNIYYILLLLTLGTHLRRNDFSFSSDILFLIKRIKFFHVLTFLRSLRY